MPRPVGLAARGQDLGVVPEAVEHGEERVRGVLEQVLAGGTFRRVRRPAPGDRGAGTSGGDGTGGAARLRGRECRPRRLRPPARSGGTMSEAARAAVLDAHCCEMKLPTVRNSYRELVRQATHDDWASEQFLVQLLEGEVLTSGARRAGTWRPSTRRASVTSSPTSPARRAGLRQPVLLRPVRRRPPSHDATRRQEPGIARRPVDGRSASWHSLSFVASA